MQVTFEYKNVGFFREIKLRHFIVGAVFLTFFIKSGLFSNGFILMRKDKKKMYDIFIILRNNFKALWMESDSLHSIRLTEGVGEPRF